VSINKETLSNENKEFLFSKLEEIKNFPKDGVLFSDISPLLADPKAYDVVISHLYERYKNANINYIAGIDSRGFLFGSTLAYKLGVGFVCVRKAGKLPKPCYSQNYDLEYGSATLEVQKDAFSKKDLNNINSKPNVVLIDDIIATGGSAISARDIINKCNINLVEICFLMSLNFFNGSSKLKPNNVYSILQI
jgi:adenine phosphoribosyltransferase